MLFDVVHGLIYSAEGTYVSGESVYVVHVQQFCKEDLVRFRASSMHSDMVMG